MVKKLPSRRQNYFKTADEFKFLSSFRSDDILARHKYQELRHGRLANVGLLFLRRLEVQPPGERPPALTPSR